MSKDLENCQKFSEKNELAFQIHWIYNVIGLKHCDRTLKTLLDTDSLKKNLDNLEWMKENMLRK